MTKPAVKKLSWKYFAALEKESLVAIFREMDRYGINRKEKGTGE